MFYCVALCDATVNNKDVVLLACLDFIFRRKQGLSPRRTIYISPRRFQISIPLVTVLLLRYVEKEARVPKLIIISSLE